MRTAALALLFTLSLFARPSAQGAADHFFIPDDRAAVFELADSQHIVPHSISMDLSIPLGIPYLQVDSIPLSAGPQRRWQRMTLCRIDVMGCEDKATRRGRWALVRTETEERWTLPLRGQTVEVTLHNVTYKEAVSVATAVNRLSPAEPDLTGASLLDRPAFTPPDEACDGKLRGDPLIAPGIRLSLRRDRKADASIELNVAYGFFGDVFAFTLGNESATLEGCGSWIS